MLDVILIGATALDIIAKVDRFPESDEIVLAREVIRLPGGSISNIAVGLARLGLKVGFIGKVGNDDDGTFLIESLKKEKVDTSRVVISEGCTASTFIAVNKEGKRIIFALGGKALLEKPEEIPVDYLQNARCIVIGETLPQVAKNISVYLKKHKQKQTVFYIPGGLMASRGLEYSKDIITNTHTVILNRKEIQQLVKNTSIEKGINILLDMGVMNVVLTLGKDGAIIYTKDKKIKVPAFKVDAVDTTGAGDAFSAGLIYSFIHKYPLEKALIFASACAALSTTKIGAREGLPTLEEIRDFLASRSITPNSM